MIAKFRNLCFSLCTDRQLRNKKGHNGAFLKVLENRQIISGLKKYEEMRETFCKERVKFAGNIKTPDWTSEDVQCVIKNVKKKKK